jgi:hypothetical protein
MNNLLNKSFVLLLVVLHYNAYGQEGLVYKTNEQISCLLRNRSAMNFQFAAWDYSFIGEYQKSLMAYDKYKELANVWKKILKLNTDSLWFRTPTCLKIIRQRVQE